VAKESRRVRKGGSGAPASGGAGASAPPNQAAALAALDPFSPERLKSLGLRLGLPLLAVWMVGILIAGVSHSTVVQSFALGVPGALTVAAVVLVGWGLRQARKAQGVAGILSKAATKDDRQAALAELESKYKGSDPTAIFARSQLLLQDGEPRKALAALETINLAKVMGNVADEARGQRAMIHLMLDEVPPARDLVDGIQLSRHQEAKSRAMLAAIVAEAWARSGQAKRAADTLSVFDPDDAELAQLRPQLFRAQAFAFAHTDDQKSARRALRRLADQDPRLLGAFLGRKTHPLLQREAKKLLEQSGAVPRKMQVQRR
jgi:hypothetical protein